MTGGKETDMAEFAKTLQDLQALFAAAGKRRDALNEERKKRWAEGSHLPVVSLPVGHQNPLHAIRPGLPHQTAVFPRHAGDTCDSCRHAADRPATSGCRVPGMRS